MEGSREYVLGTCNSRTCNLPIYIGMKCIQIKEEKHKEIKYCFLLTRKIIKYSTAPNFQGAEFLVFFVDWHQTSKIKLHDIL